MSDVHLRNHPTAQRLALRRIADGAESRGFHQVLLAVSDLRTSVALAEAFHQRSVLPALTFSARRVALYAARGPFDLIVLALDTEEDALARLIRDVTEAARRPVLVVGDLAPEMSGLADDVVPAHVAAHDVVERAHRLLELSRAVDLPAPLRWGPLELDVRRRTAAWNRTPLELTSLQFRIMEVLVLAAGAVVSFEELSRRVWGDAGFGDRERVVGQIKRIRQRLRRNGWDESFLITVRGEGFRLRDRPPSSSEGGMIVLE